MKKLFIIHIVILLVLKTFAQDTAAEYKAFYYQSGKISSEGYMRNGEPDGYWKTYYESGILKSEGNRKNFLLDSTWIFYNDSGNIVREINYGEGKKNGFRRTYLKDEIIEENFKNDVKNGWTKRYFADGVLKYKVMFLDGVEEGTARDYATDGTVITLTEYKKGYIMVSENINRYRSGLKHGKWKEFFEEESLKSEGTYYYGKKDGYFKEFDRIGNLIEIRKFENDVEIYDSPELANYEIRKEYYRSGKIKAVTSYKDDIPEGTRREYDQQGNIKQGFIYKAGKILGYGIIDESGLKQGLWKEYHESGELYGEGIYKDGKRQGEWKFWYTNGQMEQTGKYNEAGRPEGPWKWYYDNGNIKREEFLRNGIPEGDMTEYSDSGKIMLKGQFIEGEADGEWIYELNDYREVGAYQYGKREGIWKGFVDGKLFFEGGFVEDQADGQHIFYWENGKIRKKGKYISGKKEGDWFYYTEEGLKQVTVNYLDDEEISINGIKIDSGLEK